MACVGMPTYSLVRLPLSRKREWAGTDRSSYYLEPSLTGERRLMLQFRLDRMYMDGVPLLANR